jgi:hypothetical protein
LHRIGSSQMSVFQTNAFGSGNWMIGEHDRSVNSWVLNRSRFGRQLILLMRRLIC